MSQGKRIIVYGAGGHGKVVADAVERGGEMDVAGFLDDTASGSVYDLPILGGVEAIASLQDQGITGAVVTIGNPAARKEVTRKLESAGLELCTVVHPTAYVARGATIGAGCVVLPQAVIGADATIGKGCIINTGATVDHDCILEDFVHIAPGAHLAGGVQIGEGSHIGIGCAIIEGVVVGKNCMVGAGSTVVDTIEAGSLAYGSPAKRMKPNK